MKRTSYSRFLARAAVTLLAVFCFLGARAEETLTVYDGTTKNDYVPAYIYYFDSFTRSQFVIPATDLEELGNGAVISQITFYADQAYPGSGTTPAPVVVYLKEVDYTSISAFEATESCTTVFTGTLATAGENNLMTITFATPYTYNGGNLLIGIENTVDASWQHVYFYGQTVNGASVANYHNGGLSDVQATQRNFIPKTTFTYEPGSFGACDKPSALTANGDPTPFAFSFNIEGGTNLYNIELKAGDADWVPYEEEVVGPTVNLTGLIPETAYQVRVQSICDETDPETQEHLLSGWKTLSFTTPVACPVPTDVTVSDITPHTAVVSWTSDAENFNLMLGETVFENVTSPYTLTSLPSETDYTVKVQAICGGENGSSQWTSGTSFTTPVACPAPTNLAFTDITAYSANVGWTSDNENIELRYAPYVPGTDFDDSQMNGWTTIDADGDGYTWVLGSQCGGVYLVQGSSLAGEGHNNSQDLMTSGSYSNMSGVGALTPDNYLVSPQIILGGSISFWAQAQDGSYPAEHFGVAVSTTGNTDPADFTTIQEWTLTAKRTGGMLLRSSNAPRGGKRNTGTWYQYTVDLSAYSGQGYVAIRHFNCTDQFMLNVDDIVIEQPDSEIPWVYVNNPANPQALTNLEPETTYTVQVRGNCGGEGTSKWLEGSFTTLPTCMVPTNLAVSNVDKRSADLAWTPNGEEDAWQICINGDEENLINVTETTYSFTGLNPETTYSVKVRAKCSEDNQSTWSSTVTFTTLVACPAPTNLTISDIANVSAVASWVSDGDVELQYAENVWKQYDNGVYDTTMGAGGTLYWGIMLPAASLTAGEPLTKVALHTTYSGEATLNVYLGGDQPTGTPAATQTFTMAGDGDFMEIALDNPVGIDGTQNLWITFYQSGLSYSADGCSGPTDPNGRWVSTNGEEWGDIASYGYDYTWMIRAAFGDTDTEWVTVDNATSPQAITDLTPETSYFVRVKHICGGIDGESDWVTTNFTTDVACPAPTALTATPYAYSAKLSWQGTSDSYTVRYGYDAVDEAIFTEDFSGEIPADWTNTSEYPWTVVDGYIQSGNAGINSSTSTISFTMNVSTDANFEFDAKCMGEGTNTAWDKCIFTLDGTAMFTKGANGDQWDHYSFPVTAGEHTFTWSYSKDSSVNPTGDYMAVDNIAIVTLNTTWNTVTTNTNECVLTGLTPLTSYHVQVQGDCGDYGTSEWSEMITFTTQVLNTIALADDDSDAAVKNSEIITAYDGKACDVTLTGRTLYKDGLWNTICLPFDVVLEGSPLEGATAKTLTDASTSPSTLYDMHINLIFGDAVTTLEAGKPYIIRWNAANENIVDPVFEDVLIEDIPESDRTISMANGNVKFIGYYDAFGIDETDEDIFYMKTGKDENENDITTLVRTNSGRILKSCRAYFQFSEYDVAKLKFTIDFGDGSTTGIVDLDREATTNSGWYTVDGKKLDKQPTRKGVYIQNGVKVVIK